MDPKPFDSWAIIELFGHQRIAGRVTEQSIGGCSFLRVDVPAAGTIAAYTKFYTQGSIYCLTPTDEPTARAAVERFQAPPVDPFILPQTRALPAPRVDFDDDDDFDPNEDEKQEDEDRRSALAERVDGILSACTVCEPTHIPKDSINRCDMCRKVSALLLPVLF